jgi:hypothetical protein
LDEPISPTEKSADRLRRAFADLPASVRITRTAERALDHLHDEDAARLLEDIARVAKGQFPGEIKPIKILPGRPLQADAGRFRFLFQRRQGEVEVIAIFPKSSQQRVFRGMR